MHDALVQSDTLRPPRSCAPGDRWPVSGMTLAPFQSTAKIFGGVVAEARYERGGIVGIDMRVLRGAEMQIDRRKASDDYRRED